MNLCSCKNVNVQVKIWTGTAFLYYHSSIYYWTIKLLISFFWLYFLSKWRIFQPIKCHRFQIFFLKTLTKIKLIQHLWLNPFLRVSSKNLTNFVTVALLTPRSLNFLSMFLFMRMEHDSFQTIHLSEWCTVSPRVCTKCVDQFIVAGFTLPKTCGRQL